MKKTNRFLTITALAAVIAAMAVQAAYANGQQEGGGTASEVRQGEYDPYDPSSPVVAVIDNWDGGPVPVEVGVPIKLAGRRSATGAIWAWKDDMGNKKETFVWRIKDDGGAGSTITGDIINTTSPGFVTVTAVVLDGAGKGKNLTKDFTILVEGPKITKGDYVVMQLQQGWLLYKYTGRGGDVVIPASLGITVIGENAFRGSQITSVVIPEGVTELLGGAFYECRNLRTIMLPSTLRIIGGHSFRDCGFTSIDIPASVTTIGNFAFFNCKNLTEITIPASVTTITGHNNIFSGCTGLTTITVQAVKPPLFTFDASHWNGLWQDNFGKMEKLIAIYVPRASVEAYKKAVVWGWECRDLIKPMVAQR
jgi:hypothetical protein